MNVERTITNALTPVGGVETVSVDIPRQEGRVAFDEHKVSIDRLTEVLQQEYPVESVAAG